MSYDIFISYRRSDQAIARALVEALEARGASIWWDQKIEGGEDWRDTIVEGLTNAKALVILFSEDCNNSKQLKKELAVADTLDKEIIPVLIEDTTPKGHYLYELAALNWLQVYPDPAAKMGELADRLMRELDIEGQAPAAFHAEPIGGAATPPQAAPAPAPPIEADTVRKVVRQSAAGQTHKKRLRDYLPYKWYEVVLAAALSAFFIVPDPELDLLYPVYDVPMAFVMFLLMIAFVVFPIRYYMRKRRMWHAFRMFLLSTLSVAVLLGVIIGIHPDMVDETLGGGENMAAGMVGALFVVGIFSVIAFGIYGLMHFQRTMRSFNQNVETL